MRPSVVKLRKKAVWGRYGLVALFIATLAAVPVPATAGPGSGKASAKKQQHQKLDHALNELADGIGDSDVIVEFNDGADSDGADRIKGAGGRAGRRLKIINAFSGRIPNALLRRLADDSHVKRVVIDRGVSGELARTTDTVGALTARLQYGYTGAGIGVAVIDSGITANHDDLGASAISKTGQRVTQFVDFVNNRTTKYDDWGHGTHVAGIIAGSGYDSYGERAGIAPKANVISLKALDGEGKGRISHIIAAQDNAFGTVGVAPKVKLWAAKMLSTDGSGSEENLIAALDWTIAKKKELGGPWVANMSIGAPDGTSALTAAIQRALDARVILVAASGNASRPWLQYPAAYRGVISVGAVDSSYEVASFSQYSSSLSIVAPGVDIESSYLRGKFPEAQITAGSEVLTGYGITGSPMIDVQAPYINCGFGRPGDFPLEASGRICVIERSPMGAADALPFRDKAKNAKDAGAVAVIIYNDDDVGRPDIAKWTFIPEEWPDYQFPLTVALSFADGTRLLNKLGGTITASYHFKEYGLLTGTSMAAPHVTGTVALLLALAPETGNAQMLSLLERTTTDVSINGWDYRTSWGMVDALAAARTLAPAAFGAAAQPPPVIKRRSVRP
jgi:subtilisin family serine protease